MHELSLACSVVELVEKELALHGGGSVRCIEITIGDLSGVDNDAYFFSLNKVLEPSSFAGADICIINKIDLLPYVDSDVARLKDNALKINPQLCFFEISATRGMGMDEWCEYLLACFERKEEK